MTPQTIFNKEKAIHAILYILAHLKRKDTHKVSKILFFADQKHLVEYGRSITGDEYFAMEFGPVPSNIFDIFKALRGEGFFANSVGDLADFFEVNAFYVHPKQEANLDYLSQTDIECLDEAIDKCKDLTFGELTNLSHGLAWGNTRPNARMTLKDILLEVVEDEEFAQMEQERIHSETAFCYGFAR